MNDTEILLEIAVADTDAEQAPAGDIGEHAHLLVARAVAGVLPHMPPRLEAKDISVRLGAHWVDPMYIQQFILESVQLYSD